MDDSLASEISFIRSSGLIVPTSRLTISSTPSPSRKLQINGIEYELVERLPNKRGKTSWIWKEGLKLEDLSDPVKPKKFWMCQRCYDEGRNILYSMSSTAHASNHLNEVHNLFEHGSPAGSPQVIALNKDIPEPYSWDLTRFKELLIRWIVTMHISFSQVEYEAFRSLLLCLNSQLASHLPTSGNTIQSWIMEDFKQRQNQIKKELQLSKSLTL